MRYFQINVRKNPTEHGFMPTLQLYLVESSDKLRPIVIIAPGGGYTMLVDSDRDRIAMQFNAAGFHAAVLNYSVEPHHFPTPHKILCRRYSWFGSTPANGVSWKTGLQSADSRQEAIYAPASALFGIDWVTRSVDPTQPFCAMVSSLQS